MEATLNRMARGEAGRFARWYALAHMARCSPCRKFLQYLEQMLENLKGAKGPNPSPATFERLIQQFEEASSEEG